VKALLLLPALVLAATVSLTGCSNLTEAEKSYNKAIDFQEQGLLGEAIAEYSEVLE